MNEHVLSNYSTFEIEKKRRDYLNGYFCTVCEEFSEQFIRGGVGKGRPNAKCPNCGSLERHRLLWMHLANEVWPKISSRKKDLLHIAPEPFFIRKLKPRPDVNYISGDLMMSESMAKLDLTDIQFWDNQFDLVICSHVLEHIPDDRKAMKELHRILRPDGFLIVMVPIYGTKTYEDFTITDPQQRLIHFGQEDHVRKYGRDIVERLGECGFDVRTWPQENELSAQLLRFIASKKRVIIECRCNKTETQDLVV